MKPLGKNVIIRTGGFRDRRQSVIQLPDHAKEKPQDGIIVGLGPWANPELRLGDHVLFDRFQSREMERNGYLYQIVSSDYVHGRLEVTTAPAPGGE